MTPSDETAKPSWWLLLRVLDEPATVLQQLATAPRALGPIIALVAVAAIVGFATPARTLETMARQQIQTVRERAPDRLSDDEAQQAIARASGVRNRLIIFLAQSTTTLIALVVVAAVLMLIFGAVGAEPIRFKDEFAIAAHAYVPQLAGALLVVLLMIFAGFERMGLSLGFLFDRDTAPFLHSLGNQFTIFGAWNVVLLALGNQIRIGAKGLGGPLAIVGGLWIVVNLVLAAVTSAFL